MFILLPATNRLGKEGNAFLLMIIAVVLLVVCCVASCNEARYSLFGKTQIAAVDKMYKVSTRDADDSDARIRVDYIIVDPDLVGPTGGSSVPRAGVQGAGNRRESDAVDMEWFKALALVLLGEDGKTVAVQ